jgi:hypothetical protein
MLSNFRKSIVVTIIAIIFPNLVQAQPRKGEFINTSVGLGISVPDDEPESPSYDSLASSGKGFYAQGEYVLGITSWFGVRPYAGVVFTTTKKTQNQSNQPGYSVTSSAFLLGGKVRVLAPIPYVAPYFELGVGASMGAFKTYTPLTNVNKKGVVVHIPFSIGLALGQKHDIEVGFNYYFQPAVEQVNGAFAFGFTFPLKNNAN